MIRLVVVAALAACQVPAQSARGTYLTKDEIENMPSAFPTTIGASQQHAQLVDGFRKWDTVGAIGKLTSTLIDLRRVSVPVFTEECGEANASYHTGKEEIRICYELIALVNRFAKRPEQTYDHDTHAIVAFTTLHEIAHALIDLIGVQVPNDEDRADQFALLMMTNFDDVELARRVVHAPASFFALLDKAEGGAHDKTDPHSAPIQRSANAICILWGRQRDPALVERMTPERAAHCEAYTREALDFWNRKLEPYTRLDTGKTFSEKLR